MNARVIIFLAIAAIIVLWLVNRQRNDIAEMIKTARTQKAAGEQLVSWIKQDALQGRIDPRTFREAQFRYVDAQGAFEGWTAYVMSGLNGTFGVDSRPYYTALQAANQKSQAWIDWAKQLHLNSTMRAQSANIVGLPTSINLPNLWEELQKIDQQQRQQLTADLNTCRWARFDDIPASPGP